MGRPPCCDKVGIKKGPWTPEEDIILVSYIQENGPGNWRSVPTNTGLLRCSKSCRLRWTNYLRPGIKRGAFTPHEEGMIIHLQALLGNKWAAIASYLPQRTDNDIKNYWNTHLKKKIKKLQSALDPADSEASDIVNGEKKKSILNMTNQTCVPKINQTSSSYASSTENISRLLEGWMKTSPKDMNMNSRDVGANPGSCSHEIMSQDDDESLLSYQNMNMSSIWWEKYSSCDSTYQTTPIDDKLQYSMSEMDQQHKVQEKHQPLSMLEKWLLDEASASASGGQVEGLMELSSDH